VVVTVLVVLIMDDDGPLLELVVASALEIGLVASLDINVDGVGIFVAGVAFLSTEDDDVNVERICSYCST
jgi:hypothetical protein